MKKNSLCMLVGSLVSALAFSGGCSQKITNITDLREPPRQVVPAEPEGLHQSEAWLDLVKYARESREEDMFFLYNDDGWKSLDIGTHTFIDKLLGASTIMFRISEEDDEKMFNLFLGTQGPVYAMAHNHPGNIEDQIGDWKGILESLNDYRVSTDIKMNLFELTLGILLSAERKERVRADYDARIEEIEGMVEEASKEILFYESTLETGRHIGNIYAALPSPEDFGLFLDTEHVKVALVNYFGGMDDKRIKYVVMRPNGFTETDISISEPQDIEKIVAKYGLFMANFRDSYNPDGVLTRLEALEYFSHRARALEKSTNGIVKINFDWHNN